MTKELKRTLYECFSPKVLGAIIYCAKGHKLGAAKTGTVLLLRLTRGEPLGYAICQGCPDFDSMGDPVPADEKGWVKK